MTLKPIITSALCQDLYKENMRNIIVKLYGDTVTRWCFKCRNANVRFTPDMIKEIREQIDWYCANIRYTQDDINWLRKTCPWLSVGYLNALRTWVPDRSQIQINEGNIQAYNDCGLAIEFCGTWFDTTCYEIPILAIVNEVYFAFKYGIGAKDIEFQRRAVKKFDDLATGKYDIGTFAEFGLRRRYSADMQDWLIKYIVDQKVPGFVGTSNMLLAKKYGVKPIGTMAHEFGMASVQGNLAINPAYTNRFVMKAWTDEYKTQNGIMLDDVIGSKVFLKDFDLTYATLFSGVRHDSGDPYEWGENLLAHYAKLGIDAKTKTLLFSDSLDFEKATALKRHFNGRCKVAFGIGTWLANDTDAPALNIVCKITEANGHPVAKLSNDAGKTMCRDEAYVDYLRRCIDWRLRYEK